MVCLRLTRQQLKATPCYLEHTISCSLPHLKPMLFLSSWSGNTEAFEVDPHWTELICAPLNKYLYHFNMKLGQHVNGRSATSLDDTRHPLPPFPSVHTQTDIRPGRIDWPLCNTTIKIIHNNCVLILFSHAGGLENWELFFTVIGPKMAKGKSYIIFYACSLWSFVKPVE